MASEETISYHRLPEGAHAGSEVVTLSVSAIEYLADAGLRAALHRAQEAEDGREHLVFATQDDTYSHYLADRKDRFDAFEGGFNA